MKRISYLALPSVLISSTLFAAEPVTLSGPSPSIAPSYSGSTSSTIVYTLTNNVPQALPVTVSGISNGITRTTVANDCGNTMPAGPATCNIGISINPSAGQIGSSISQTMVISYQGRTTLTSPISFSVIDPFAYVSAFPNATSVLKSSLDATTGQFLINTTAYDAVGPQAFDALTFATVGGVQYGYVLDQNGFVYQCDIDANGTFDSCTATPQSPPGWNPHGIAFATVNGTQYAYVVEVNGGNVYQCTLNVGGASNGSFNNCGLAIGFAFNAPYGIAFGTTNGTQYAYIAEAISGAGPTGSVYQCGLNGDGTFTACTAQLGSTPWIPYAVTFATVGGTQYAYVADNGTSTAPPNGNIYKCTLVVGGTFNGSFDTCSVTIAAPTTNWTPADIAFTTLNGTQFAYVPSYQASYGDMSVCTLNTNGTFATCNSTTGSPPVVNWTPVGIAFRSH